MQQLMSLFSLLMIWPANTLGSFMCRRQSTRVYQPRLKLNVWLFVVLNDSSSFFWFFSQMTWIILVSTNCSIDHFCLVLFVSHKHSKSIEAQYWGHKCSSFKCFLLNLTLYWEQVLVVLFMYHLVFFEKRQFGAQARGRKLGFMCGPKHTIHLLFLHSFLHS